MDVTPRKFLIKNLIDKTPPISVWLQGTIEQTVGTDILILNDGSGRAKITKCDSADGVIDKKSIHKGVYCCVIGLAIKMKGLAEVQASKLIDLSDQPCIKAAWDSEVREVELYLQGKLAPHV